MAVTPTPDALSTKQLGEVVHIIGAGGVGMSGLALLLARTGASVTASDKSDSPYLQKLREKGITTWVGSQPERIRPGAQVFYSSAIKPEDPERAHAERSGFVCASRHALLQHITQNYFTVAVAGCHGKTTTSAWVAQLFERAGFDPTALIGGTVPQWNSNYREGNGTIQGKPLLVIEADESDRSFLNIETDVALVTNIDLDHTDVHASLDSLKADFRSFIKASLARGGWAHVSKECEGEFVNLLKDNDRQIWADTAVDAANRSVSFAQTKWKVGLAGAHNLMNATLVAQLAQSLQISDKVLGETLEKFTGVNRRMQKLAEYPRLNLTVIDDYAHHPHEVQVTLAALAGEYEKLLIFWEPHRLSRFNHFHEEFAAAFLPYANQHSLYSLPIFASGDKASEFPETEKLLMRFRNPPFVHIASREDFSSTRAQFGTAKTAAVFMGAGNSSDYARQYADWLKSVQ